jgi:hypothetical protein
MSATIHVLTMIRATYLLLSILIIVSLAGKSYAHALGPLADALGPDVLVKSSLNANVAANQTNTAMLRTATTGYNQASTAYLVFMAFWAKDLISLIALGALFLNVTPTIR